MRSPAISSRGRPARRPNRDLSGTGSRSTTIDNNEVERLTRLRHSLHRCAELAHSEQRTARRVTDELRSIGADDVVNGLGGHGVAAIVGGGDGPTVLFRADMDALPIAEDIETEHASETQGVAHKCGHDGHMTIALGVAGRLVRRRPERGRVVVLFQPAEETGDGAIRVLGDPRFAPLRPDAALAVHNLPGFELGSVIVRSGPFACASRGLVAEFRGATSHAAEPERGRSPALAVAQVIQSWSAARQLFTGFGESMHATVIHAAVGRPAFGTSPGDGRVMATLRAPSDEEIEDFEGQLRRLAKAAADAWSLEVELGLTEPFPATRNDEAIVGEVLKAARSRGLAVSEPDRPFPWSEDFGHFSGICPSALVGLGAGIDTPDLHHPRYDFPDELLPYGVDLVESTVRRLLNQQAG